MANVLIIDDNTAVSAILKIALSRQRHLVRRSEYIREAISPAKGLKPDLVLINHAFQNYSGWKVFNYLKKIEPRLPAIVCVLKGLTASNVAEIGQIVEAVLSETMQNTAFNCKFGT